MALTIRQLRPADKVWRTGRANGGCIAVVNKRRCNVERTQFYRKRGTERRCIDHKPDTVG